MEETIKIYDPSPGVSFVLFYSKPDKKGKYQLLEAVAGDKVALEYCLIRKNIKATGCKRKWVQGILYCTLAD